MSEGNQTSGTAVVPDAVDQTLIDGSEVQTKVGHVAKFLPAHEENDLEQNSPEDALVRYKKPKANNEFIGLNKEELKAYINNPKWKRIRWIIAILYILLLVVLLAVAIVFVIFAQRCPPKPKLVWHQKDIIYEIDVVTFRDTNEDGIGDIKGIQEKLPYFESNQIKSILLQSSIFNATSGTSIESDGRAPIDLLTVDPLVGTNRDLEDLAKSLNRKDMHLIIDLPLSSTADPTGYSWYGSSEPLATKINNPCIGNPSNLACRYYKLYGRLPLDFSNSQILEQSKSRLRHWLLDKKIDGIRVNLPLELNPTTRLYNISYDTLKQWNEIKNEIEKKTKPKLLLIDVPFGLQDIINHNDLHNKATFPLLNQQTSTIDAKSLNERIQSFEDKQLSKPLFWQLGSKRRSDDVGVINPNQLSKEMVLTMALLFGGTPVVLYGEEIGLDQKSNPLMAWTSDGPYGGFTSCSSGCSRTLSSYRLDLSKTSVKRQEALGGQSQDSLLTVFRRLSKLRQADSFQYGLLETGYNQQSNIFWFIREAPGHEGYVVVFNLNKNPNDIAHISLHDVTHQDVPAHIHYRYQWPKVYFPGPNDTHIDSDNLFIHPQSINIFSWAPKLLKPNILFQKAKQHSHTH